MDAVQASSQMADDKNICAFWSASRNQQEQLATLGEQEI
jgi:hypothetical protein